MGKKKIVVLTGAGVSAESGISTFRDNGGLWDKYDVNDVASIDGVGADGFGRGGDGCGDHCVRHGNRRGAIEEAALVHNAVPGDFLIGKRLLVVAEELERTDKALGTRAGASDAIPVFLGMPRYGLVLTKPIS